MDHRTVTAFTGNRFFASGKLEDVALMVHEAGQGADRVLIFDDHTGRLVDLDHREPAPALPEPEEEAGRSWPRRPGRPKLGVVAREVTLLPRHWDWLARQPGGASVALRRLVDEARRLRAEEDKRREAREACYAFISAMVGDEVGFEEASRALFAGDAARFGEKLATWPEDVAAHARHLASPAFAAA